VMSFDSFVMKRMREAMEGLDAVGDGGGGGEGPSIFLPNRRRRRTDGDKSIKQSILRYSGRNLGNSNDNDDTIITRPKLLLVIESDPTTPHGGTYIDITDPNSQQNLIDICDDTLVDGVYLQYQEEMLSCPETAARMREFSGGGGGGDGGCDVLGYDLGVWMLGKDPDSRSVAERLVKETGAKFVNSDFPRSFF